MEWPDILGDFDLDEGDLFNLNIGQRGDNLFLGFFYENGLRIIFEKYKVKNIGVMIATSTWCIAWSLFFLAFYSCTKILYRSTKICRNQKLRTVIAYSGKEPILLT